MADTKSQIFIGTAAWTLPAEAKEFFPPEGTHLQRYSQVLNAVEINSSFYREHKPATYRKWAAETPDTFRFSVKLSRFFTQEARLKETGPRLTEVLAGISELGAKWGALLVQLPPSLEFNLTDAEKFLTDLSRACPVPILWEPRHRSWTMDRAMDLLENFQVSKVFADPEPCQVSPRYEPRIRYFRWHGSPEIYKSRYDLERLSKLANELRGTSHTSGQSWWIFDNTTFGYATLNALELQTMTRSDGEKAPPHEQTSLDAEPLADRTSAHRL